MCGSDSCFVKHGYFSPLLQLFILQWKFVRPGQICSNFHCPTFQKETCPNHVHIPYHHYYYKLRFQKNLIFFFNLKTNDLFLSGDVKSMSFIPIWIVKFFLLIHKEQNDSRVLREKSIDT